MGRVKSNVILIEHTPNPDKLVSIAARLCYSDATINDLKEGVDKKEQDKFIAKLIDMSHLSPIEHISFTFGIEGVSRAFLTQITRHRLASFSVKSQRYVDSSSDFNYILPPSISNNDEVIFKEAMHSLGLLYEQLANRVHIEDARFVLPNAAETKMIITMNARELLHFFELRCCNRAQWEIKEVALKMLELCKEVAPSIFANAGAPCVSGKCKEKDKTCGQPYSKGE